jgi:ribosome-associated toxin RatA of RatAB toxin-antitoxin module
MAAVETEHVFSGDLELVKSAIRAYQKYPKYLPGVTKIEVLPAAVKGSVCQVRYELNLIKRFHYTLNMFDESPNRITWTLADSNLMKTNDGSWTLASKGDSKTKAVYSLDVKFKGLVPGAITDQIAKANLPLMMSGFQRMIDDLKASS